MSKVMNECVDLFGIRLNHVMTASVFFHWFRLVFVGILELILCRICLLIKLISDLDRLISLHVGLLLKFALWSFNAMNASLAASASILLSSSRFLTIFFSFDIIYLRSCLALSCKTLLWWCLGADCMSGHLFGKNLSSCQQR